jgi:uncharacterized cofD-like protein
MQMRTMKVGCLGGGTGLPSVLAGLKRNPWLELHGIVTMFDSGGSSGQLRDELGVLPPGDVLRCALALSRNEREARRLLLSRLPTLEDSRLGGHTGGNLLLSMMEQYSGNFLAAIEGLRGLLGCKGRVWPVSTDRSSLCARYEDGSQATGEVEVDRRQADGYRIVDVWLEPQAHIHSLVAAAITELDAVIIGPGSFYTSLMPIFAVTGVREALAQVPGPFIYITNIMTEGRGMSGFTAADAVAQVETALGRPIDTVVYNEARPHGGVIDRYAAEYKNILDLGTLPSHCRLVRGRFWRQEIARHDRPRLGYALWAELSRFVDSRPRS